MNLFRKFHKLREAFRATFWHGRWRRADGELSEETRAVLADLKAFCGAEQTSIVVAKDGRIDPLATTYAEGKRAVLLRIQSYLNLSDEQLLAIRGANEDE